MIFIFHVAAGILIARKVKFLPLAALLAFLSHYILDFIPHPEYSAQNIKNKRWKKSRPDFLRVMLDVGLGLTLIVIAHHVTKISYFALLITSFFSILPDMLSALNWQYPNNKILKYHAYLHQKIHFQEEPESKKHGANRKTSAYMKVFWQILVVLIGIVIFLS